MSDPGAMLPEAKKIATAINIPISEAVAGKGLTTIAIGGAICLFLVEHEDQAAQLIKQFSNEGVAFRVIGAGSNLLISDSPLLTPIIKLGRSFKEIRGFNHGTFEVGASASLMALARQTAEAGFSGLEFGAGIPASIGGAVVMNAGAHGGEIGDVLLSVRVVLPDGSIENIKREDLSVSYRCGGIPSGSVVLSATFQLIAAHAELCSEKLRKNLDYRKQTQPLTQPSFGSVFRNPEGQSAGGLIEAVGLKGYQAGGAVISPMHANWIVNPKKTATADDVKQLIALSQTKVREAFDVKLHPEVVMWDDETQG